MARKTVCIDVHKKAMGLMDGVEPRAKSGRLDAEGKPRAMSIAVLRKQRPGLSADSPVKHAPREKEIDGEIVRRAVCIDDVRETVGVTKPKALARADEPTGDGAPPPARKRDKHKK